MNPYVLMIFGFVVISTGILTKGFAGKVGTTHGESLFSAGIVLTVLAIATLAKEEKK